MPDTIDASIPLQAGHPAPVGPDIAKMITAQKLAEQLRMMRQTNQGYNALGALYANPDNIDEVGRPKPGVMNQFISMFPQLGLEVQGQQVDLVAKQARAAHEGFQVQQDQQRAAMTAVAPIYEEWLTEKARNGGDEAKANQALQGKYTEFVENCKKGGQYSAICDRMAPNMDGARMGRNLMGMKGIEEQQQKDTTFHDKTDYGTTPPTQYREYDSGRIVNLAGNPYTPTGVGEPKGPEAKLFTGKTPDGKKITARIGPTGGFVDNDTNERVTGLTNIEEIGKPRQLTPAAQAFSKFMDEHPNATSEEQTRFLESQRPARSGPAAAVRKYMEENPNATASDIAAFNAWQRETSAGAQAFGSGQQGSATRAQNVAIDHLGVLSDDLIPALGQHDTQAVNRLTNWAKTELGYEGPVDFNFAKGIVSQEIEKSIVNVGAGTKEERSQLADSLSTANSPEQLNGVIRVAKRLMAGQLRGLQQQYVDVSVPPDKRGDSQAQARARSSFQQKLFPRTIEELGGLESKTLPEGGAEAPIPPASRPQTQQGASSEVPTVAKVAPPPISMVPQAQRQDGKVVTFADEKGVQHKFVIVGGGTRLMPSGP